MDAGEGQDGFRNCTDLHRFHDTIPLGGALPLTVLEAR